MSPIDYSKMQRVRDLQQDRRPVASQDVVVSPLQHANGMQADPTQPWGVELGRIRDERERLTQDQKALDVEMSEAIKEATRVGATYSEMGALLGITKQRVGQIVASNRSSNHEQA